MISSPLIRMEAQRLQVGSLIERMHQGRSKARAQLLAMHREVLAARQENQELRHRLGGPAAAAAADTASTGTAETEAVTEEELRQQVALLQSKLLQFQGFLEEAHSNIGELQVGAPTTTPTLPNPVTLPMPTSISPTPPIPVAHPPPVSSEHRRNAGAKTSTFLCQQQ